MDHSRMLNKFMRAEDPGRGPPRACVFIANLPADATNAGLQARMAPYGHVLKLNVVHSRSTTPYAFVQFAMQHSADAVLEAAAESHLVYGERLLRAAIARVRRTLLIRGPATADSFSFATTMRVCGQFGVIEAATELPEFALAPGRGAALVRFAYREDASACMVALTAASWAVEWARPGLSDDPRLGLPEGGAGPHTKGNGLIGGPLPETVTGKMISRPGGTAANPTGAPPGARATAPSPTAGTTADTPLEEVTKATAATAAAAVAAAAQAAQAARNAAALKAAREAGAPPGVVGESLAATHPHLAANPNALPHSQPFFEQHHQEQYQRQMVAQALAAKAEKDAAEAAKKKEAGEDDEGGSGDDGLGGSGSGGNKNNTNHGNSHYKKAYRKPGGGEIDERGNVADEVFVGGLNPLRVTKPLLKQLFSEVGEVVHVALIVNDASPAGAGRGGRRKDAYGFVRFETVTQASNAIERLNGLQWLDRHIRVQPCKSPKKPTLAPGDAEESAPVGARVAAPKDTVPSFAAAAAGATTNGVFTGSTSSAPVSTPSSAAAAAAAATSAAMHHRQQAAALAAAQQQQTAAIQAQYFQHTQQHHQQQQQQFQQMQLHMQQQRYQQQQMAAHPPSSMPAAAGGLDHSLINGMAQANLNDAN